MNDTTTSETPVPTETGDPTAPAPQPGAEPVVEAEIDLPFEGHTYRVPTSVEEWPIEALEAFETNMATAFLKAILGAEQWAEFRGRHAKVREFAAFGELVVATSGMSSGN